MTSFKKLLLINLGAFALAPLSGFACACGCGLITPGTESLFPKDEGGLAYVQYDYQDQNRNWHGTSSSDAANNDDKNIRTSTVTFGARYMFNSSWGAQMDIPYVDRSFTTDDGSGTGGTARATYGSLGDIRIKGIYTGLEEDMSTGFTFGLKLPTGDFKSTDPFVDIDRDTQIGTGSTDALLGVFHRGDVGNVEDLKWIAQFQSDLPMFVQDGYRPGFQFDASAGISYHGLKIGSVTIAPVAQVIGTVKTRDHGENSANPVASGYERLLLAPGIEATAGNFVVFADVELPVYYRATGEQLTSSSIVRLMVGYKF